MRRYWIQKNQIDDQNQVHFSGEQFHHIFDVCRQVVGHHFEVITEDSKAFLVEVLDIQKKKALAIIKEERIIAELPTPRIHLVMSLPRFAVIDSVIERAVEMGVTSIHPCVSDFSHIRKVKEFPIEKYDRWKKIVISATQQSGRGSLMQIAEMTTLEECLKNINLNQQNWCLLAYEGKTQSTLNQELARLKKMHNVDAPSDIWVLVGSEGGFSEAEIVKIADYGLNPVTLGPLVLRVETACLTLVSVLKYEFGLMK